MKFLFACVSIFAVCSCQTTRNEIGRGHYPDPPYPPEQQSRDEIGPVLPSCQISLNLQGSQFRAEDLFGRVEEAVGSALRANGHQVVAAERDRDHLDKIDKGNAETAETRRLGRIDNNANRESMKIAEDLDAKTLLQVNVAAAERFETRNVSLDGNPDFVFTFGPRPPPPRLGPRMPRSKNIKIKCLTICITWKLTRVSNKEVIYSGAPTFEYEEPYSLPDAIRTAVRKSVSNL